MIEVRADRDSRYGPYPRCIYCDDHRAPENLTNEHAFPRALGGRLVLLKASCTACGAQTSAAESKCLNEMFGTLRAHLNIRRTRAKGRRNRFPLTLTFASEEPRTIQVPIDQYPVLCCMATFAPPGLVRGVAPSSIFENPVLHPFALTDHDERCSQLVKAHGANGFVIPQVPFHATAFAKMIAKMAHSTAVAFWGLDSFTPLLPPIIRNQDPNIAYFVGCAESEIDLSASEPGYKMAFSLMANPDGSDRLLAAYIRLFPWISGTPTYMAIVGRSGPTMNGDLPQPLPPSAVAAA